MIPPADSSRPRFPHPALADPRNAEFLQDEIARSPDPEGVTHALVRYAERNGLPTDRQQLLVLLTLSGQSPFLAELLLHHPAYLPWAASELARTEGRTAEDLRQDLARFRFTLSTLSDAAVLRRFKYREYLRIALLDLLGSSDLAETTHELSLLADVLVREACLLSHRELLERYGPPQYFDDQGRLCEATFAVLSFGKLGGEELNYSSDIDLVYLYSREGQTAGVRDAAASSISNKEFFTRLGEGINRRIAGVSPEGQVFRVDLDLRPGGKDGELVHSRRAFLAYYRTWARNWERQALLKARASAGDLELGTGVLQELQETIYPAAGASFAAMEIKEMKDRIDQQLSRTGRSELDIKLGTGGLRELEFGVQALQLTQGAREPWLHEGNTLRALHRLADKGFVSYGEHSGLSRAYDALRRVEHRLQLERNRQTDLLPSAPESLRILARRLGYLPGEQGTGAFLQEMDQHRALIRGFYDSVFRRLAQPALGQVERDLLLDPVPDGELRSFLASAGAPRPEEASRHLARIRRLFSSERIRPDERREMRRVSASILAEAVAAPEPERTFMNLERFLSSLLVEQEATRLLFQKVEWIPALIRLFGKSEALSQILARRPRILEDMENAPDFLREEPASGTLQRLNEILGKAESIREAAAALRKFRQKEILLIGLRDVHRQDSLSRTLRCLTDLAQTCLAAGESASSRFVAAAGLPKCRFTVLGLGRLGYQELDYNSDLDLVFVTEGAAAAEGSPESARRRAEILIHLLTAVTQEGSLYSVDLRLRPAGGEGELVQTRSGILDYFRERADTWEKLAFLKARPVAGDLAFGQEIVATLREEIFAEVDPGDLAREVKEMKARLEEAAGRESRGIPLKLGSGGIMDIHFLIEFLQIRHRLAGPVERDTLRMLSFLYERGILPQEEYPRLYSGYLLLRSLDHAMRLLYDRPGDFIPPAAAVLSRLAGEVSLSHAPSRDAPEGALGKLIEETRDSIRDSFQRLVR
jgi:[glutamine synthetase] adenylyltransferase / [glutamine synthetase]-adenylyl-L-tyrosine phosphorylase